MYYNSLNRYLREKFGKKVYKIAIDGGFTCPNRDGTLHTRGCIFCSASGSGDFASDKKLSITEQIENAKLRVSRKTNDDLYIAYFQAYTNTYAPIEVLRQKYTEAISHPDVVAVSIATRPDCISNEVYELLDELNRIKPIWIELGLQTVNEESIRYIRRCYPTEVYIDTAKKLRSIGIEVITHVILGLPNETKEDMLKTVALAGKYSDGIKLQLLHVLKGTDLLSDYNKGLFHTLSMDEYIDILCDCIEILPPNVVIHRLTGDGDKKLLVSPLWSADKKTVLNAMNKEFYKRNIIQGKFALTSKIPS